MTFLAEYLGVTVYNPPPKMARCPGTSDHTLVKCDYCQTQGVVTRHGFADVLDVQRTTFAGYQSRGIIPDPDGEYLCGDPFWWTLTATNYRDRRNAKRVENSRR